MGVKKLLWTLMGFLFLGLGVVGVAMPVLPTTPFVLLAALCFSTGNSKIARWLHRNPFFGPYIENYRTKQGVKKSLKMVSILFVWTGLIISMIVTRTLWIVVMLAVVGVGVTVHLLMIKTRSTK